MEEGTSNSKDIQVRGKVSLALLHPIDFWRQAFLRALRLETINMKSRKGRQESNEAPCNGILAFSNRSR